MLERDIPDPEPGVEDQITAATAHNVRAFGMMVRTLPDSMPEQQWTATTGQADMLQRSYILAAIMDVTEFCPHIGDKPMPMLVSLGLRRTLCFDCASHCGGFPSSDADRCDVCGTRGHEFFTPVAMAFGPMTVLGDVCDECAGVLIHP